MAHQVVVIASILKPVDDTRLYEKLGRTIGQATKYRVNIIGFKSKKLPSDPEVIFHPIFSFNRVSWGRLIAPWKFMWKLIRIKPSLVIVSTPELLFPAAIYRLFSKGRLWYDVQENYHNNVQHQKHYAVGYRTPLLLLLRLVETASGFFIDHYLLAEQCYVQEMNFTEKYTVLANKYQGALRPPQLSSGAPRHFVYSGTLAAGYGLIESIVLIQTWHKLGHQVTLTIIGQIHSKHFLGKVKQAIAKGNPEVITFVYDHQPIPHQKIMQVMETCNWGIVAHQPNPSNAHCIPTRIYEFLGMGLPFLLQQHPPWQAVVNPYQAALVVDFQQYDPADLWKKLQETTFYAHAPGPEITWDYEAAKLLPLLES